MTWDWPHSGQRTTVWVSCYGRGAGVVSPATGTRNPLWHCGRSTGNPEQLSVTSYLRPNPGQTMGIDKSPSAVLTAYQVDQGEHHHPHAVHEMPVPGHHLDPHGVPRVELPFDRQPEND